MQPRSQNRDAIIYIVVRTWYYHGNPKSTRGSKISAAGCFAVNFDVEFFYIFFANRWGHAERCKSYVEKTIAGE